MIGVVGLIAAAAAAEAEPPAPDASAAADPPADHRAAPVRWSWVGTLAATSRNLSLGGAVRVGPRHGLHFGASLTTDWPFSALVAGFLLDDVTAPRVALSQVVGWSFPWPVVHGRGPWAPDLTLGVGAWELVEVDSLAQAFRTGDAGVYGGFATGAQLGLVWPTVTLAFGLRPFGAGAWWHDGEVTATGFQFTNAVLDVDVTVDLGRLFPPKAAK